VCSQKHCILQQMEYLWDNGVPGTRFIAPLIGSFSMQGTYIVLPSLRHFSNLFSLPNAASVVLCLSVELANSVQFLHNHYITHLDIKPDNLTLTTMEIQEWEKVSIFLSKEGVEN
jgi:serine/threonine protein kinase